MLPHRINILEVRESRVCSPPVRLPLLMTAECIGSGLFSTDRLLVLKNCAKQKDFINKVSSTVETERPAGLNAAEEIIQLKNHSLPLFVASDEMDATVLMYFTVEKKH